jgi:uncharacterized protein YbjT (DUF2867 family)
MSTFMVLGGTGRTGRLVVDQALSRGHRVHAVVRNPSVLQDNPNLVQFTGTPEDTGVLRAAAAGADGVLFALNNSRSSDTPWAKPVSPPSFMTRVMANTLTVMQETGTRRIVVISAVGVGDSWPHTSPAFRALVRLSNIHHSYDDHNGVDRLLRDSAVDWTLLRAAGLSDRTAPGTVHAAAAGGGGEKFSLRIGRSELAGYALDVIEHGSLIGQAPTVWSTT